MPIWERPPFLVLRKLSNEEVAARRLLSQASKCASTSEKKISDDKNINPHNISGPKEEYTDYRVSSINDSHLKKNVCTSSLFINIQSCSKINIIYVYIHTYIINK